MTRFLAGMAAAVLLSACGGKGAAPDAPAASGTTAPRFDAVPSLDTMVLGDVHTYCAFFPAGHEFVFDDPETWEFVFVTLIGDMNSADGFDGLVSLNGARRTVELITQTDTPNGETRTYRTKSAPAAVVTVVMEAGEDGVESTAYTGSIAVTVPEGGEPVAFEGDCGV